MAEDRAPPILPSVADVIGAGKARIIAVRPSAKKHLERGRWAIPVAAWRGQFVKARARLAAEVKAAFLGSAEGDALSFTAASNFDTPRATAGSVAAIGSVTLTRRPSHYLPSAALSITTPDASSFPTLVALLASIRSVFNTHAASVYDPGTGLGAHIITSATMSAPVVSTMGDIVATLNAYKTRTNLHVENPDPALLVGGDVAIHLYPDSVNIVSTATAFASDAGASYASQTTASQQSALALANALKRAINAHMLRRSVAGTIKAGARVRLTADLTSVPPIAGGEYEVTRNTFAGVGSYQLTVPVRAVTLGPAGNLPTMSPARSLQLALAGSLYDAAEVVRWGPSALTAAGGSEGQSDALLRRAASAAWQGSYGPTRQALVAGVLRVPGLVRCSILRDTANGSSVVYALDESWAQSGEWQAAIEQTLRTDWLGVGAKLSQRGVVVNRVVRVTLAVVLRSRNDLADVNAITDALGAAIRGYFDGREDFYVFRLAALRAVCSRAHKKILKCTSAIVLDTDGTPIAEPTQPSAGGTLTHWLFAGAPDAVFDASS